MGSGVADFEGLSFSVAMTGALDARLAAHLDKGARQEDLAFVYWRPSVGASRFTAILTDWVEPRDGDRILEGNASYTQAYVAHVLAGVAPGSGIALLHSHLGPGWQDMSREDVVAERDRLASAVAGRTGLPLVGLTRGTDGAWSAGYGSGRRPGGIGEVTRPRCG